MKKDKDIEGIDPFAPVEGIIITYMLLCGRKYDQETYEHYIIGGEINPLVPDASIQNYAPKTVNNDAMQKIFSHFMYLHHLITYIDYQLSKVYHLYKDLYKLYTNEIPITPEFSSIIQYSTQDIVLSMVKFIELFSHKKMEPYTGEITIKYKNKFGSTEKFIRTCANAYKHTWINSSSTMNLFGKSMPMVNAVYVPDKKQGITEKYMASLPAVVIAFRDIYEYVWLDKTHKHNHKIITKEQQGLYEWHRGEDPFFTG